MELLRGQQTTSGKPPEQSELLRRPLNPVPKGGSFHEGGVIFAAPSDTGLPGAARVGDAARPRPSSNAGRARPIRRGVRGLRFFAHRVQPCSREGVHDAAVPLGGDVPRLPPARRVGRELLVHGDGEELPVDVAPSSRSRATDVMASRIVRKNVCPRRAVDQPAIRSGLIHRGGPLFEDFAGADANGSLCAHRDGPPYDYDNGDRLDPGALHDPRVAPSRAGRADPGADVGHRVREADDPRPCRIARRTSTSTRAARSFTSWARRCTTTGAITLRAPTRALNAVCGLDPVTRTSAGRPSRGTDADRVRRA